MRFVHATREYFLEDEWWADAGMEGFVPASASYRADLCAFPGREIAAIAVDEVEPLSRQLSHGVFNDSPESGPARQRVISILRGFRANSMIPPVEVVQTQGDGPFRYRLLHGAHRFYCSVAAGFSHIPAVVYQGSDVEPGI
jgi:hypothetical protein